MPLLGSEVCIVEEVLVSIEESEKLELYREVLEVTCDRMLLLDSATDVTLDATLDATLDVTE